MKYYGIDRAHNSLAKYYGMQIVVKYYGIDRAHNSLAKYYGMQIVVKYYGIENSNWHAKLIFL